MDSQLYYEHWHCVPLFFSTLRVLEWRQSGNYQEMLPLVKAMSTHSAITLGSLRANSLKRFFFRQFLALISTLLNGAAKLIFSYNIWELLNHANYHGWFLPTTLYPRVYEKIIWTLLGSNLGNLHRFLRKRPRYPLHHGLSGSSLKR